MIHHAVCDASLATAGATADVLTFLFCVLAAWRLLDAHQLQQSAALNLHDQLWYAESLKNNLSAKQVIDCDLQFLGSCALVIRGECTSSVWTRTHNITLQYLRV